MVRAAAAAPAARPNSAVAAEVRRGRPWPRTTSAARRGAARRPRGRGGDLSPSSLRNRQRLRTQHPRPRAPPLRRSAAPRRRRRRRPRPAPRRESPRRARRPLRAGSLGKMPHVAAASLFARKRPRGAGRGNCSGGTRPRPPASPRPVHPSTRTRGARAAASAGPRTHFSARPRAPSEPLLRPARAVPAFSRSVTVSQNPITSHPEPPAIGRRGG
ncbi:unnamed protein product [Nyctereutes procyonoides]|uniref:(raccoon dog) hypothetical protein n=1 Tax=Nyctereutes procyonoides TaxID=34880 RepID=A0A811ZSN5_NYCPR|nr:unnamed protein product [Nyctereutes procyonoides]